MGLQIDIAANTRAAVRGMGDLEKALDENADALTDLARDGDRAGDKLETTFRDMVRDADKAGRAMRDVGDDAHKGFDKTAKSAKQAADAVDDATSEMKNEAKQNFSEMSSSFDGSMESIADLAQSTLGGLASSDIPGIGAAAGLAALGVGVLTQSITDMQEKAAEKTQNVIDQFLDLGDALDAEAVKSRVRDIFATEDTRKQAQLLADLMDINVSQAALAMAGDLDAAGVSASAMWDAINNAPGNVSLDTWMGLQNTINATNSGLEAGEAAAAAYSDAMSRKASTDLAAAIATGKVVESVDELGNKLYALPDGKQIMIDADTGRATTDIDGFKGDLAGVPQEVKVRLIADDSALRAYSPPRISIPTYFQTPSTRQLLGG